MSRTGNSLSPKPFVSHTKASPAKKIKTGYGDENACSVNILAFTNRVRGERSDYSKVKGGNYLKIFSPTKGEGVII